MQNLGVEPARVAGGLARRFRERMKRTLPPPPPALPPSARGTPGGGDIALVNAWVPELRPCEAGLRAAGLCAAV